MLHKIISNTNQYKKTSSSEEQKEKGQFFTSLNTAKIMGDWYIPNSRNIKILEPGAGNGSLTAATVIHLVENDLCDSLEITYVENDRDVIVVLRKTVKLIKNYCAQNNIICHISIMEDNYILTDFQEKYDLIICNPPYKKIRKNSEESIKMSKFVHGQPNLYALFMAKSVDLLNNNGSFIFITPRSWTSGSYFSKVRTYLAKELSYNKIHIFNDRDKSFSDESVLQEAMILFAQRSSYQQYNITISISDNDYFKSTDEFNIEATKIKNIGKNKYLLIPTKKEEAELIGVMNSFPDTFFSLGYIFKTGPVVEFRNKNMISTLKKSDSIPMYRSLNISNENFVFPVETSKAQYISLNADNLLIRNENTVLIRRLSAKEDDKRIQSCIYYKQGDNLFISIENHVNYVSRKDGKPLSADEVEWIQALLSSEEYDTFFRLLNGSTQVNANELNYLPVRSRAI
jgi:adenine-specific DNA-methyltransferase